MPAARIDLGDMAANGRVNVTAGGRGHAQVVQGFCGEGISSIR